MNFLKELFRELCLKKNDDETIKLGENRFFFYNIKDRCKKEKMNNSNNKNDSTFFYSHFSFACFKLSLNT